MNFFKIFAIVILVCSIEMRGGSGGRPGIRKSPKKKHAVVHHKKGKAISHKLATRSNKRKSQKHRNLLLENLQMDKVKGKAFGIATGAAGIALTQLERAQQKQEIQQIKSQIHQQAAVIGGQQAKVMSLLKDLDSKIDTMRNKVINMQSDIDSKIIEYRKSIKRRLDEDDMYNL